MNFVISIADLLLALIICPLLSSDQTSRTGKIGALALITILVLNAVFILKVTL